MLSNRAMLGDITVYQKNMQTFKAEKIKIFVYLFMKKAKLLDCLEAFSETSNTKQKRAYMLYL